MALAAQYLKWFAEGQYQQVIDSLEQLKNRNAKTDLFLAKAYFALYKPKRAPESYQDKLPLYKAEEILSKHPVAAKTNIHYLSLYNKIFAALDLPHLAVDYSEKVRIAYNAIDKERLTSKEKERIAEALLTAGQISGVCTRYRLSECRFLHGFRDRVVAFWIAFDKQEPYLRQLFIKPKDKGYELFTAMTDLLRTAIDGVKVMMAYEKSIDKCLVFIGFGYDVAAYVKVNYLVNKMPKKFKDHWIFYKGLPYRAHTAFSYKEQSYKVDDIVFALEDLVNKELLETGQYNSRYVVKLYSPKFDLLNKEDLAVVRSSMDMLLAIVLGENYAMRYINHIEILSKTEAQSYGEQLKPLSKLKETMCSLGSLKEEIDLADLLSIKTKHYKLQLPDQLYTDVHSLTSYKFACYFDGVFGHSVLHKLIKEAHSNCNLDRLDMGHYYYFHEFAVDGIMPCHLCYPHSFLSASDPNWDSVISNMQHDLQTIFQNLDTDIIYTGQTVGELGCYIDFLLLSPLKENTVEQLQAYFSKTPVRTFFIQAIHKAAEVMQFAVPHEKK